MDIILIVIYILHIIDNWQIIIVRKNANNDTDVAILCWTDFSCKRKV